MPRLRAIRYIDVGHREARARDVTLPCTDGIDPAHSLLWLRNGGGKSTLLALVLSVVAPNQRAFLRRAEERASSEKSSLADYLVAGELGVVACEWTLDGTGLLDEPRLVTLVALDLDTTSGERTLFRWFAAALCQPGSVLPGVEALPAADPTDPGRRLTLARLRDWFARLRDSTPASAATWTEKVGEWEQLLRDYRIDPDLFYAQSRMNQGEGEAGRLFAGITTAGQFAAYCLDLLYGGGSAAAHLAQFRDNVVRAREAVRRRRFELQPERDVLFHVLPTLETLGRVADAEADDRSALLAALAPLVVWDATLPSVLAADRARLAGKQAERATLQREVEALSEELSAHRRRAAHLGLRAAEAQRRTTTGRLEATREARSTAEHQTRIWRAADAVADAQRARRRVEEAQRALDAAKEGAEPLRALMLTAAGRAHGVCRASISILAQEVADAQARRRDVRDDVQAHQSARAETRQRALMDRDRLANAEAARAKAATARDALGRAGTWPAGLTWADALRAQEDAIAEAEDASAYAREADRARRAEAQADNARRTPLALEEQTNIRVLGDAAEFTANTARAAETLAARAEWAHVEGGSGGPGAWTAQAAHDLRRVADLAAAAAAQLERWNGAALEARDALSRGDPLPESAGVIAARDPRGAAGVAAASAWDRLRAQARDDAHAVSALTAWPALASAVVVPDADWPVAERVLQNRTLLPPRASLFPVWACSASDLAAVLESAAPTGTPWRSPSGRAIVPPLGAHVWIARASTAARPAVAALLEQDLAMLGTELDALRAREAACRTLALAVEAWASEHGPAVAAGWEARAAQARDRLAAVRADLRELATRDTARQAAYEADAEAARVAASARRQAEQLREELRRYERAYGADPAALDDAVRRAEALLRDSHDGERAAQQYLAAAEEVLRRTDEYHEAKRTALTAVETLQGLIVDAAATPPDPAANVSPREAFDAYNAARQRYHQESTPSALMREVDEAQERERAARADAQRRCAEERVTFEEVVGACAALPAGKSVADAALDARQALGAATQAEREALEADAEAAAAVQGAASLDAAAGGLGDLALSIPEGVTAMRQLAVTYEDRANAAFSKRSGRLTVAKQLDASCATLEARCGELNELVTATMLPLETARLLEVPVPTLPAQEAARDVAESFDAIRDRVNHAARAVGDYRAASDRRKAERERALRQFRARVAQPDAAGLPATAVPRLLKDMSDQDLAASAPEQVADVRVRLEALEGDLQQASQVRARLVGLAQALGEEGARTLKTFCRHTRLPDGLDALSGAMLLEPRITEVDADAVRANCGERIDRWCEGETVPEPAALLAELVMARCASLRFTVLRPDVNREHRREELRLLHRMSGGEKLTVATVLYCALARTRAELRSDGRLEVTSVLMQDNPFGKATRETFVDVQCRVAQRLGIQLLYWTGINDVGALSRFPNLVRLRNTSIDRRTGRSHITLEVPADAPGSSTGSQVVAVARLTVGGELPFAVGPDAVPTGAGAPVHVGSNGGPAGAPAA